jgi:hypothetical protein
MPKTVFLIFLTLGYIAACAQPERFVSERKTKGVGSYVDKVYEVGPKLKDCMGMVPQKYMVVDGGFFYDPIKGFNHESGNTYQIKVRRTQIYDPSIPNGAPMDASIYRYDLLEIISKKKAGDSAKN